MLDTPGREAPVIEARGIRYVRDGQAILDGVDLAVPAGESLAITGPSGSGKTSLLAVLAGLTAPAAGEVYVAGKRLTGLPGPGDGVAMVLQGYGLVSLLTAAENIEVAVRAAGIPAPEAQAAAAALEELGLGPHAGQIVEELSGGQQQRVAVARALVTAPSLILADEPTGNLDSKASDDLMGVFDRLNAAGRTIVLITHDDEVAHRADRVVVVSDGRLAERNGARR